MLWFLKFHVDSSGNKLNLWKKNPFKFIIYRKSNSCSESSSAEKCGDSGRVWVLSLLVCPVLVIFHHWVFCFEALLGRGEAVRRIFHLPLWSFACRNRCLAFDVLCMLLVRCPSSSWNSWMPLVMWFLILAITQDSNFSLIGQKQLQRQARSKTQVSFIFVMSTVQI